MPLPRLFPEHLLKNTILRRALLTSLCLLLALPAQAAPGARCAVDDHGQTRQLLVPPAADALGGTWLTMEIFSLRATLASPPGRAPWLLVEVYARAADGDLRIISSQSLAVPFRSGRMDIVEPILGRHLIYECGEVT